MNVVITCGPAWEPLDGMRRLTNASTGRLGSVLADAFVEAGHRVILLRGEGSTAPLPRRTADVRVFGTNDDLATALKTLAVQERVDAVLHAAALCDFRVATIRSAEGVELRSAKIPSRGGNLFLELEPATKVLPSLRKWFPEALLAGWKFELAGVRDDALRAAWRQLAEADTDACVLNGSAWGTGFAVCEGPDRVIPCSDAEELSAVLLALLGRPRSRVRRAE